MDPQLELIRRGKIEFMEHAAKLQKKLTHVHFWVKLKKGQPLGEEMDKDKDLLKELGFWEPVPN